MDPALRLRLTRSAMQACTASVVWALALGIAAIGAGANARSLALVAFGLETLVDGSASVVLVWRFSVERRSPARADHVEHLALRLVGTALLLAAGYVTVRAGRDLATRSGPESTTVGLAIAGASVLVLPLLAYVKLRLSRRLGRASLRADGVLSAAGASLAGAALLGLVLANTVGWWWADSVAALVVAAALAAEAWRALSTSS